MAAPTTAQEAIEQAVLGPKSVTVSQGSETVVARDVSELIAAANHLGAGTSATKPHFGLRFSQIVPPGGG